MGLWVWSTFSCWPTQGAVISGMEGLCLLPLSCIFQDGLRKHKSDLGHFSDLNSLVAFRFIQRVVAPIRNPKARGWDI